MSARHRDWALQAAGLVAGIGPAIMFAYGLVVGLALFVLLTGVGMLWVRTRSFFYGAMCSLLALPGLVVAALLTG